jgi:hypothetical protein
MTEQRYNFLMDWTCKGYEAKLTLEEIKEGWHWCPDWDFLLVGPGMEAEQDCCGCFDE